MEPDLFDEPQYKAFIERHFAFLVAEGFPFTTPVSYEGGLYMAHFAVGPQCQVKFASEKGDAYLFLGHLEALRDWGDGKGPSRWYSLYSLIACEDERDPARSRPPSSASGPYSRELEMNANASIQSFYVPRLRLLFTEQAHAGWWKGYEYSRATIGTHRNTS